MNNGCIYIYIEREREREREREGVSVCMRMCVKTIIPIRTHFDGIGTQLWPRNLPGENGQNRIFTRMPYMENDGCSKSEFLGTIDLNIKLDRAVSSV